ncbi:DUF4055 domain-containing protein [Engelhardtia mirabilis]|uniref:DUF4055 domain-containing protein n=1 Tax=Engelhardtia mirabilis TaxID=2528011 RepID=A0A518BL50_9BACT|nr:hypothetical protein Pla133_27870 [Planctomycetes bacterium Pla133]QDV02025.1 hypothetical protein Pla86_27860 [Planctomycetes bacterium Pla86]
MTTAAIADKALIEEGVGCPSLDVQARKEHWGLPEALLGGTTSMRRGGERWLPKWTIESPERYAERLQRSFLFGIFSHQVGALAYMPFQDRATITPDLPEGLSLMRGDIDGQRTSMEDQARQLEQEALAYGIAGIYVEGPANGEGVVTRADEMDRAAVDPRGAQPRFKLYRHSDILEATMDPATGAVRRVRLLERVVEQPEDGYQESLVNYAIEATPAAIQRWKFVKGKGWEKDGEERENSLGIVPFVMLDLSDDGRPPLDDLAWLNLKHWQVQSDFGMNLAFGAIGLLTLSGDVKGSDDSPGVAIQAGGFIHFEREDGSASYVEQTGAALGAHRQEVLDIETRAVVTGSSPLTEVSSVRTATEVSASDRRALTKAESWARQVSHAFTRAMIFAHKWVGVDPDPDLFVSFSSDFAAHQEKAFHLQQIALAVAAGTLPRVELVRALQRFGVIDSSKPAEELMEGAQNDSLPPPLGSDETDDQAA